MATIFCYHDRLYPPSAPTQKSRTLFPETMIIFHIFLLWVQIASGFLPSSLDFVRANSLQYPLYRDFVSALSIPLLSSSSPRSRKKAAEHLVTRTCPHPRPRQHDELRPHPGRHGDLRPRRTVARRLGVQWHGDLRCTAARQASPSSWACRQPPPWARNNTPTCDDGLDGSPLFFALQLGHFLRHSPIQGRVAPVR